MKKKLLQKYKFFLSAILFLILSILNYYNLKDKAFIKLEKYDVSIKNEMLAKELGSRIQLNKLLFSSFKPLSKTEINKKIKIDNNSFILINNWNTATTNDQIKDIKIKIYNEYKIAFKVEKENIQNRFIDIYKIINNNNTNFNGTKLDKLKLEETSYLRKLNKFFYNMKIILLEDYLYTNIQLRLIEEVRNNNFDIVTVSKSFEKKEYLIFFALVFNQIIIFIIVFFFFRSIPKEF